MEDLVPPPLQFVRQLRWGLLSGRSAREVFQTLIGEQESDFHSDLRRRWIANGLEVSPFPSHYQSCLWQLIIRGTKGEPVLEALENLEEEILLAVDQELDAHISTLPFRLLIPLLFLQFPAYLLVMLGPIIRDLNFLMGGV